MEVCRRSSWLLLLLGVSLLATTLQGVQGEAESDGPSESECRPYIEKALKELEIGETSDTGTKETGDSKEDVPTVEITTDDSDHRDGEGEDEIHEKGHESTESVESDQNVPDEQDSRAEDTREESEGTGTEDAEDTDTTKDETDGSQETGTSVESDDQKTEEEEEKTGDVTDEETESTEADVKSEEAEDTQASVEESKEETKENAEADDTTDESQDTTEDTEETTQEGNIDVETVDAEQQETSPEIQDQSAEETAEGEQGEDTEEEQDEDTEEEQGEDNEEEQGIGTEDEQGESVEEEQSEGTEEEKGEGTEEEQGQDTEEEQDEGTEEEQGESTEGQPESSKGGQSESTETEQGESTEGEKDETNEEEQEENINIQSEQEEQVVEAEDDAKSEAEEDEKTENTEDDKSETKEDDSKQDISDQPEGGSAETETTGETDEESAKQDDSTSDTAEQEESKEGEDIKQEESQENVVSESDEKAESQEGETTSDEGEEAADKKSEEESESAPEEELSLDIEIPADLRERNHVEHLLKLDDEASETEKIINRVADITLRELKKLYENAIKPLEVLYKYRDLSNRHFGDSEIFSKPLILFMGPWSGGKSSIINYLLDNEYNETSLRTGAEPSPAYFNILMYGEEPEIIDGTQLAADFTFSGLQKFGQGLEERLRGVKLPSKLLEKVNIVEIPGILEVRKQVSRVFPFNDACQWFIDRADIIFLVYDPSKLDVGPETEAILDQLKGREHQTRIILNKADQVKPEELMRVQGALIWNISPLMSSPQPPIMYTTSLWSRPYESWAPVRLLQAQERAFLRDLRSAVDKRIENKIASARRFAVRVRNHAKMVDCYLTTYYNHKSVFGNRKQVADEIIEHPQDYHIYEGLSTLTNISRYDLPDPDVYKDFFKLNPLYDFQQLSATCTYFRGCPINRLDVAIAYDLPELVGKHKRLVEGALAEANQTPVPGS